MPAQCNLVILLQAQTRWQPFQIQSHICVNCSKQQYDINYWNMYAPIIQWSTICLMFIILTIFALDSQQIDYTQAFPQATLDDSVYMCIPQGWYYCPHSQMALTV